MKATHFRWLPNAISLLRIVLIVPILVLILRGRYELSLALFFIAGLSDGLDGWLANRYNWQTRFGEMIDPIADKLLVTGLFVSLAWVGLVPVWFAAVVILRDIIIVAGALAYSVLIRPVPGAPTRISKLNTALTILFLLLVLSHAAFRWPDDSLLTVIGAGMLLTVVVSGIDYVWSWSKRARKGASD